MSKPSSSSSEGREFGLAGPRALRSAQKNRQRVCSPIDWHRFVDFILARDAANEQRPVFDQDLNRTPEITAACARGRTKLPRDGGAGNLCEIRAQPPPNRLGGESLNQFPGVWPGPRTASVPR